ncbi:hypothetical protein DYB35_010600 [Aphanomyces astaci]|uniref:Peptidase M3A/M3B catalytic domain-containing protein n=2 Tax=Aphanomyces astaci TaxID=112090 RepID=A0A418DX84_APHAT|nr:hypothetical protein DYB35_010600 [Aphanomyces astaci]
MVSGHVDTGAPLPDCMFGKLVASTRIMAATNLLKQLEFSALDMALHHQYDPYSTTETIFDVKDQVAERYLWSEAMSADAFGRFEEATTPEEWQAVGRDCRDSLLAMLGSAHPLDAFKRFRRRPPNMDALLRSYGLD